MRSLRQGKAFYKDFFMLMIPMVIQQFITNLMALADTFMVGALGETELAAITIANSPFFVVQLLIFGIQSGACVLVAQYHGKGNTEAINKVLGIGLYASCLFSFVVLLIQTTVPEFVMHLLTNNESLVQPGADYSRIVCISYFFSAVSGIYIAVQRSMGNTRLGAVVLSVSGVMNVVLNWMLIFGNLGCPALGVEGAAIATTISRAFEVAAVAVYAVRDRRFRIRVSLLLRPGIAMTRDFIKYAMPVVINELLWSFATSLYTVIMGHMADNTPIIAAFTIAGNIERVLSVCMFAASGAAAIVIGREIGKGGRGSIREKAIALNAVSAALGVFSLLLVLAVRFLFAEDYIFPLMGLSRDAVGIALYMLTFLGCAMPLRAVNITNVVGVFRGGGDVRYALICDVAPIYFFCLPAAAICALVLGLDIRIVYPCMFLDEIVKVGLCVARLRSGKWINDVTREDG